MAINYQALKTELLTDPNTYGYAAFIAASEPENCAAALNKVRDGTDGEAAIRLWRNDVPGETMWAQILITEYTALPANPSAAQLSAERRYLAWISGLPAIKAVQLVNDDGTDTPAIENFKAMFPAGSGTRTRLNTVAGQDSSRAEQLFGAGTVISTQDVATALQLP